jgi:hypothetical protein
MYFLLIKITTITHVLPFFPKANFLLDGEAPNKDNLSNKRRTRREIEMDEA